jgi:hypothetical protein
MSEAAMPEALVLMTDGPWGVAVTRYAAVEPPPADPFVRRRFAAEGDVAVGVVTEYAAAPGRPPSYPAWLPFVPGRPVFTTEAGPGGMSPGARWPCGDRDEAAAVLAEVERGCLAAGWVPAAGARVSGAPAGRADRVLARDRSVRLLLAEGGAGFAVVQLLDVPDVAPGER